MTEQLEITTPDELEAFLKDYPVEWAQVMAMRIALRVLPIINQAFRGKSSKEPKNVILFNATARACLISWVAYNYPTHDKKNAYAASLAIAVSLATSYAVHAAHAAHTASLALFSTSQTALATAVATAHAAHATSFDIWEAISADAALLLSRTTPTTLASSPLWPDGEPEWAAKERRALFALPIDDLDVWQNWYQRISQGQSPFGFGEKADEALSLKIATQDDAFWDRDFGVVNGDIKGWIEEVRAKSAKPSNSLVSKKTIRKNIPEVVLSAKNLRNLIASAISELETQKPNSDENLAEWEAKFNLLKDIENKAAQIVNTLISINSQREITPAVEKSVGLIGELLTEFQGKVRENKSEIAEWLLRLPAAAGFCWLASAAGATMPVATPLIFGIVGGKKVYDLVKDGTKPKGNK